MAVSSRPKVFRLQNVPPDLDRLATTELLARTIDEENITTNDILIYSLADTVEPLKRWPTKVATLTFRKLPTQLREHKESWRFSVAGLSKPLILDTHFNGFTPLNDVGDFQHSHE